MQKPESTHKRWLKLAKVLCEEFNLPSETFKKIIKFCFPTLDTKGAIPDYTGMLIMPVEEIRKAIRRTHPKMDELDVLLLRRHTLSNCEEVSLDTIYYDPFSEEYLTKP